MILQGTQNTYRPREDPVTMQKKEGYIIWEVKGQYLGAVGWNATRNPAGVALIAPEKYGPHLKQIFVPKDEEIIGRVAIFHFCDQGTGLMVVAAYPPVNIEGEDMQVTQKVWDFVEEKMGRVNGATKIVIGADANGRVGDVREFTSMKSEHKNEKMEDGIYRPVGPWNKGWKEGETWDKENTNGKKMR